LIRRIAPAIIFLLLGISVLSAAEPGILITEEVQLRVADTFMEEKEYYRAITEYKRFLILFPDSTQGDYVLLQTGIAYFRGGESEGAVRNFEALRERYPQSCRVAASLFFDAMALWKGGSAKKSGDCFLNIVSEYPDSRYSPRALAAAALIELDGDNPQASRSLLGRFIEAYPDHLEIGSVHSAIAMIDGYTQLPQKSEVLAGILSAVIPGAGYAYAGDYGTAVMSFFVNGAFIAGAWTAFAKELYAVGGVVGGVGVPFYIGNIYGSALAVKKSNRAVKQEVRERVYEALGFALE
jgi:outer membrane protein assembly factor BamD (BamD/ComL family)